MNSSRIFALVVIALIALQSGCDRETQAQEVPRIDDQSVAPVLKVVTISPKRTQIVEPIFVTGTVLAHKTTDLVPLVGAMEWALS